MNENSNICMHFIWETLLLLLVNIVITAWAKLNASQNGCNNNKGKTRMMNLFPWIESLVVGSIHPSIVAGLKWNSMEAVGRDSLVSIMHLIIHSFSASPLEPTRDDSLLILQVCCCHSACMRPRICVHLVFFFFFWPIHACLNCNETFEKLACMD